MLTLLFDEDVHGDIMPGLRARRPELDLLRVHDLGLTRTPDAIVLEVAAAGGRVVVSQDKGTLVPEAWARVANGQPMPGVIIILPGCPVGRAITELELYALASTPDEIKDQVVYIPIS